jgi:hypothetical protein
LMLPLSQLVLYKLSSTLPFLSGMPPPGNRDQAWLDIWVHGLNLIQWLAWRSFFHPVVPPETPQWIKSMPFHTLTCFASILIFPRRFYPPVLTATDQKMEIAGTVRSMV